MFFEQQKLLKFNKNLKIFLKLKKITLRFNK